MVSVVKTVYVFRIPFVEATSVNDGHMPTDGSHI